MHCNGFVADIILCKISNYPVLGISPLCPNYCFHHSRHTLYQILTHISPNLFLLHLHPLPKFLHSSWWIFIPSRPPLEVTPEMLNWIEVRRLLEVSWTWAHGFGTNPWPVCWYAWGHYPVEKWYSVDFCHNSARPPVDHPPEFMCKALHSSSH